MNIKEKTKEIAGGIEKSREVLTALGDENRQHMILMMLQTGRCNGLRAVEIAEKTNLSRAAVSHHLQILKEAGLVETRREGTQIYYYFDPDIQSMETLIHTLVMAVEVTHALSDRREE